MLVAIFFVGGFLIGLAVGRWWAVAFSIPVAVAIGTHTELEVPPVAFGATCGAITAASIASGVLIRRRWYRRHDPTH